MTRVCPINRVRFAFRPQSNAISCRLPPIIMIGATVTIVMTMRAAMAMLPFIVGVLTVFVAYGRWRLQPHAG